MRISGRMASLVMLCLGLVALANTVSLAHAAPNLGTLMLRATDLGPGYYESSPGYSTLRSGIMQPGFPIPGQERALTQHRFAAEFYTLILSRKLINNTVVSLIRSSGDEFATPAGAHWAFKWTQIHVRDAGLYQRRIRLPGTVGDESYGLVPMDGNPGRGVIFRQGRYLVQIVIFHRPPQMKKLVGLASLIAERLKLRG